MSVKRKPVEQYKWITVSEAATLCRLNEIYFRSIMYIPENKIAYRRELNGRVYIRKDTLVDYLGRKQAAAAQ